MSVSSDILAETRSQGGFGRGVGREVGKEDPWEWGGSIKKKVVGADGADVMWVSPFGSSTRKKKARLRISLQNCYILRPFYYVSMDVGHNATVE